MPAPIRRQGTQPISLPPDLAGPAAPAKPKPPQGAGDQQTVRPRAQLRVENIKAVNLNEIEIPEPPTPPAENEGPGGIAGWFQERVDGIKEAVSGATEVAGAVGNVIKAGVDAVGDGIQEIKESREEGQGLLESIQDGLRVSGQTLYRQGVDPLLDKSVLGADNEANDQGVGALGPLLTNRLAVGESVDFTIEAGATLPTQLVGAPNIKADGGGTLRLKRVIALDANDQPLIDPVTQKPETRLEIELIASGKVGGAYSAKVGFKAKGEVGQFEAGIEAQAVAEAEAGLTGSVSIKLHVDPDSPEQMSGLTALMKTTANNSALAQIPGIGAVFGKMSEAEQRAALSRSATYIESVSGSGGMYLAASARTSLEAGLEAAEAEPSGASLKDVAKEWVKETATEAIAEELNFNPAGASASVAADFQVSQEVNLRNSTRTVSVSGGAGAELNANLLAAGGGVNANSNRQVDFVFSPAGELQDVNIQQTFTKEEFLALQNTLEDFYGRPFDEGFILKAQSSDSITVNFSIRPEVLAGIKQQLANGSPGAIAQAAKTVLTAAISKNEVLVKQGDVIATTREEFSVGGSAEVAFFGVLAGRARITAGHQQESKV